MSLGEVRPTTAGDLLKRTAFHFLSFPEHETSRNPCSNQYCGTKPMSEPETRAIGRYAKKLKPIYAHSFHSYFQSVTFPYGYEPGGPPAENAKELVWSALLLS